MVTSVRQRNVLIGNILINNNYGPDPQSGSVSIRLYHSDAPERIFSTWNLAGSESSNLVYNNQNIVIGGDWGIQIVFGNGVTSCIYPVADVGRFENGRYVVTATNIYEGTTPQPSVIFPITGNRKDSVANGRMPTSFTLNSNGQLTAVTNTSTGVQLAGFTGGVSIILLDNNKQPIWASKVHKYGVDGCLNGVDGCLIGTCNHNDNWSDSVPANILSQVRGYAILQQHTPKWLKLAGQRGEQFLRWLNSDEGKATVSSIVAIASML